MHVCVFAGVRVCKFLIRQLSAVATTPTFPHSQAINFQGALLLSFLCEIRPESFGLVWGTFLMHRCVIKKGLTAS